MKYRYKNMSGQDLVLVGRGFVKAGAEVETTTPLENPNLELINDGKEAAPAEAVATKEGA